MTPWVVGILAAIAGLGAGFLARELIGRYRVAAVEKEAKTVLEEARRQAKSARKNAEIRVKEELLKAREAFEQSTLARRKELESLEERIAQREVNLERKVTMIDKKESVLDARLAELEKMRAQVETRQTQLERMINEEQQSLQRVAGMTREEARRSLLERMEREVHAEVGVLIRHLQEEAKETAEREAQRIVAQAVQRYAAGHAGELMTSTVALPNDDMKGRIIGRDGRNIRTLEAETGVNFLIDDTPEAVVISGFDPVRREVARQALERLITDGRIHPARIEEVVGKVKEEMEESVRAAGEEAIYVTGVQGVAPELVRTLGRLKYRSSYAQNVLDHSIEVAQLMGVMAGEMGMDVSLARRIGLFHDIGKALDHKVEGGHAIIGADVLKRHGEQPVVLNAVAAHHEEVEAEGLYAILAAAADAISGSRPGARAETTDIYVKRLENLEAIANGFAGVEKSYAVHAGREVRVIVQPAEIDDNGAMVLARDISKKIESDLKYPGQIRVTVIRETRCVEYAK